jgi:hypothetical protein
MDLWITTLSSPGPYIGLGRFQRNRINSRVVKAAATKPNRRFFFNAIDDRTGFRLLQPFLEVSASTEIPSFCCATLRAPRVYTRSFHDFSSSGSKCLKSVSSLAHCAKGDEQRLFGLSQYFELYEDIAS